MKNILKIAASFFTLIVSATAELSIPPMPPAPNEIHVGPKLLVYALQQAHTGTLVVEGQGLKNPSTIIELDLRGMTADQILEAFTLDGISLEFKNPNEYTITKAEILDEGGNKLFRAEHWWKLQKSFARDGQVKYTVPEWAGNLWFSLQDIQIPFMGQSAVAYLNGGEILTLDVYDGRVSIPGWMAYSHGILEITNLGGGKKYFDLQTGSIANPPKIAMQSNGKSLGDIQSLGEVSGTVQVSPMPLAWNQTVYEGRAATKGTLTITTNNLVIYNHASVIDETVSAGDADIWPPVPTPSNPTGMWFESDNVWKYINPTSDGTFNVSLRQGQVIYFYFVWNDDTSGKG